MTVLVAGGGPVARSLAAALEGAGVPVQRWRRAQLGPPAGPPASTALIAVSDPAIGEVAALLLDRGWLAASPVLIHTAGAIPPSFAFAGSADRAGGLGLLHPLRALPPAATVSDLGGTVFGIAGDPAGRTAAGELAQRLAGHPLFLEEAALPRYHAAAALAGNHTLALVAAAIDLLVAEGLDRPHATGAIAGLLRSAAENVAASGLPGALTGPIARGDAATVSRHLDALPRSLLPLYRATACATVELARAQGHAAPAALDLLALLLGCPNRP